MTESNSKSAIQRGAVFGLLYVLIYIPAQVLAFFNLDRAFNIPNVILGTVSNLCFVFLLWGVLALAQEKNQRDLFKYAKIDIGLTILLIVFSAIALLVTFYKGTTLLVPLAIMGYPINLAIGILNIRLAKSFLSLKEEYANHAVNAAKWNRIGGWFLVIPVLDIIGYFCLFVGEYNVWKIIQQRAKQERR